MAVVVGLLKVGRKKLFLRVTQTSSGPDRSSHQIFLLSAGLAGSAEREGDTLRAGFLRPRIPAEGGAWAETVPNYAQCEGLQEIQLISLSLRGRE